MKKMLGRFVALGCAVLLVGSLAACSDSAATCSCGDDVEADAVPDTEDGDSGALDAGADVGDSGALDAGADVGGEGLDVQTEVQIDAESDLGPPPVCGDGVVGGNEQCDLGDDNGPLSNCLINCANNPVITMDLGEQYIGTYEGESAVDGQTDDTSAYTGEGCWATSPGDDSNGDGEDKFELFLDPNAEEAAVLGPFTVDDIDSFFYATRKPTDGPLDFYVTLYTVADGEDDGASWYGYRLTAEPVYARNIEAVADQWALWSTDEGANQLTFFDYNKLHTYGVMSGQPTLAELQGSDAFDWSTVNATGDVTAIDYGAEAVKYLSIQTASNWSDTFEGQIDYIGLRLKDGRGIVFDLEP